MSDKVTEILAAVKTVIQATEPGINVWVRQRGAVRDASPNGGWLPGDGSNCYLLSMSTAEKTDDAGAFSHRSIEGTVRIDRVRSTLPSDYDENPDTRDNRTALRNALAGTTGIRGVVSGLGGPGIWEEGEPYSVTVGGNTVAHASVQFITYRWYEPRGA